MAHADKPLPHIGPDTERFWAAARDGRLSLPVCDACHKAHWPPGPVCPFCFGDDLTWTNMSGRGTISTFTVVHRDWYPALMVNGPYNVIQVELEEGPRLTANLVDAPPGGPDIGMAVEIVFDPVTPEITLPRFRPR
jgi:uncharacterized OB-fold protein